MKAAAQRQMVPGEGERHRTETIPSASGSSHACSSYISEVSHYLKQKTFLFFFFCLSHFELHFLQTCGQRDMGCRRKVGRADRGEGSRGLLAHSGQTCICCCSLFFSVCSWRLHSSSSPTRASSSDTTSSSSCLRAASRPRVSSASAHSSASARSCSARRMRSSSSWGRTERAVGGQLAVPPGQPSVELRVPPAP